MVVRKAASILQPRDHGQSGVLVPFRRQQYVEIVHTADRRWLSRAAGTGFRPRPAPLRMSAARLTSPHLFAPNVPCGLSSISPCFLPFLAPAPSRPSRTQTRSSTRSGHSNRWGPTVPDIMPPKQPGKNWPRSMARTCRHCSWRWTMPDLWRPIGCVRPLSRLPPASKKPGVHCPSRRSKVSSATAFMLRALGGWRSNCLPVPIRRLPIAGSRRCSTIRAWNCAATPSGGCSTRPPRWPPRCKRMTPSKPFGKHSAPPAIWISSNWQPTNSRNSASKRTCQNNLG